MYIYVLGTVLSILFAKFAMSVKKYPALQNSYRIWGILSFLPLFLITAFRYDVGTDYINIYTNYFYTINEGGDRFREVTFNLINIITYSITDNPALMFAVVAFLSLLFYYLAFYQQSINPSMSVFWFVLCLFYFNSLNQMRQALAMAILIYALKYVYRREAFKFFAFVAVAFTIHTSALIYIPIYFLYGRRVNVKIHAFIIGPLILLYPVVAKLIYFLISKTPFAWYLQSVYSGQGLSLFLLGFQMMALLLMYYCYLAGRKSEDKEFDLMVNMYMLAICAIIFSAIIPQADRIAVYMTIITPIMIPKALLRIKEKNRRLVVLGLFIAVFTMKFVYDIYLLRWYDVIPYQTIFGR